MKAKEASVSRRQLDTNLAFRKDMEYSFANHIAIGMEAVVFRLSASRVTLTTVGAAGTASDRRPSASFHFEQ
ncbi:hypothetical protein GB937_009608 [Aspergillus fischeri]|nr:hypothetical protein GB937_009608 [Aspergillus fischeri]